MAIWILGVVFFAVSFVPRFFTFMNFGYGFSDLGLYSQLLAGLARNDFNPVIPTYGKTFLDLKPEFIWYLFWPVTKFSVSPTIILFMDTFCLIIAAGVCARVAARKAPLTTLTDAVFFAVLFSPLTLESLHAPSRMAVWAQAPLALLFSEYVQQRRPFWMTVWFTVLCLFNLNFAVIGALLVPLLLFTKLKRWNWQRRAVTAAPVGFVTITAFLILHLMFKQPGFDTDFFFGVLGGGILILLITFWFFSMLSLELTAAAVLLLMLRYDGGVHDVAIAVPLVAIGAMCGLEILGLKDAWLKKVLAGGIVAANLYWNLTSADPYLTPWKPMHYKILPASKAVHDVIAEIPPDAFVIASDSFAVHLANRPSMATLAAWNAKWKAPDYILARHETTPFERDSRYRVVEINSETGTRLFKRIK